MSALAIAAAFSKFGSPLEAAAWMSQHAQALVEQYGLEFVATISRFVSQMPNIAQGG